MKQSISTPSAPSAPFFSQAIVHGGLIFLSGMVHILPDNTLIGDTTQEKLAQVMKNIETILQAAGAELSDVVKVVAYVTDMSIMPDFNKAYTTYFSDPYPVRETVCVKALPLGASIELSVIATKS